MIAPPIVPIFLAGIASILLQQIWFSPRIFGSAWVRFTNVSPEQIERDRQRQWSSAFVGLISGVFIALALFYLGFLIHTASMAGAAELAIGCWLGFCAPTLFNQVLWDQKPAAVFFINSLYWLLSFLAIAVILFYTGSFQ